MIKKALILSLFLVSIFTPVCSNAAPVDDVVYLPTDTYFDTLIGEIDNAKESVKVYMYLTSVSRFRTGSKPYQLVNAVISAKDRGLDVEVVLDENIDFQKQGNLTEKNLKRTKNIPAYEIFKQNNVPVFFDSPSSYTHSKVIVIDGSTTILGSANWSTTALTRNIESNVLIRSKNFASEVLSHLESDVQRQNTRLISPQSVYLSWDFMNDSKLLGDMVSNSDEKAFYTYLQLLKEYDGNPEAQVIVKYDDWIANGEVNGIWSEGITKEAYRREANRTLRKLQDKYHLITFSPKRGDDATVILKSYANPDQLYSIPQEKYISIPRSFWIYTWDKELPFKATVLYILNFGYSNLSVTPPTWFASMEDLAERHSISTWFIGGGTEVLREYNLIEVEYDEIPFNDQVTRLANRYSPNNPYDRKRLESHFQSIGDEYGHDKLQRAKDLLAIVHENSDANAAVALIKLEDKYGLEVIQQAKAVVQDKKDDNPKKSIAYLLGTIKSIGVKELRVAEEF